MKLFERKKTCEAVEFIYRFARTSKRGDAYKRTYRNIARILALFEQSNKIKIMSNTFTDSVLEEYVFFLKDKKYMKSTISGYVGKTAYMFRKMSRRGFEVDFSFEDVIIEDEECASVYLTTDEIKRIYEMKISNKERAIVRDRFVCNCLVGMRYSDFSKLTSINISHNIITRKTQKTGEYVAVPVHPIVAKIIKKHHGTFPQYEKSLQNYNVIVKKICKQAGLTDKVLWERTVGHNIVRKTFKRYELVGSHTARRSFATNAYIAGIPAARIMLITGHKTEVSFFKYIRITKTENALSLAEHPFFS